MNFYKNGNYVVCIMDDGTKIRRTEEDEFIPSFAENCDVKITDKCSQGCPFCYEGCTKSGEHADLFKYDFINSLHAFTEMALNGNDLDHPDLEKFLKHLKEKKVFANITVNQNQFMSNFELLEKWTREKLIYGLGISLNNPTEEFLEKVKMFSNAVIHTINGILSKEQINAMANAGGLKILILGYKNLQRGISYKDNNSDIIKTNQQDLKAYLSVMLGNNWFKVVSFDNLALEQLNVKSMIPEEDWNEFYMGDDGHYTFYIDMVKGEFAKNSLSQNRYPIGNMTIDEMFEHILKMNNDYGIASNV